MPQREWFDPVEVGTAFSCGLGDGLLGHLAEMRELAARLINRWG